MTSPHRIGSTRRLILLSALAVVAVFVAAPATGLLVPRAAEAQRSSSSDRRGFLGVALQDLDSGLRDSYDFKGNGVLVADVTPGSPAEKVGIREGDILVKIDDRAVSSAEQVTDRIGAMSPGTMVGLWVSRDGDTRYLGRAELAQRQADVERDRDVRIAPRAPKAPRAPRAARAPREAPAPHVMMFDGRGRLGVQTHDLDTDLGAYFKAPGGRGVLVLEVLDDTPAAAAGLKSGDVITSVDGTPVKDTEELRGALREQKSGNVDLRILRSGTERTMTATLKEAAGSAFELHSLPGGGSWMGSLDDGDEVDENEDDGEGRKVRKHVFRWKTDGKGHDMDGDSDHGVRVLRNLDELRQDMSPRDRRQFDEEMEELRKDLRELRRELRDLRDDRR